MPSGIFDPAVTVARIALCKNESNLRSLRRTAETRSHSIPSKETRPKASTQLSTTSPKVCHYPARCAIIRKVYLRWRRLSTWAAAFLLR